MKLTSTRRYTPWWIDGVFFVCQYLLLAFLALLWQLLLAIPDYITYAMSWILYGLSWIWYGLLLASAWLTDLFTLRRPLFGGNQHIQLTDNTTSAYNLQETYSNGGNRPGMNGIPSDWVRIRICPTDEISELQLDNDTGNTHNGMQNGEIGGWQEREQFVPTKAELEQRVWAWMDTIDAWIRAGCS